MYIFLSFLLCIPIFCKTDYIVQQPETTIATNLLAGCPLPRNSKICNPDSVLAKDEVEDVEYVLQTNCEAIDSIGIYISKPLSNNIEQGFLIRKAIGEEALIDWYPDCKLSILFVIWITNGQLICSGFRRLLSPLDPIELKELCDEEIKKNATMVKTLRGIIMNTRRHVFIKKNEDIAMSLSYSKLSIILIVKFIVLALLAAGIYVCYIGWKKYSMNREMQKKTDQMELGTSRAACLAEVAIGSHRIRSLYGTYLRANKSVWTVFMVPAPPGDSEAWYIEEHEDQVALKAHSALSKPEQYLRAYPDGSVLLESHALACEWWSHRKHNDGSWSFKSYYDLWLSVDEAGQVYTTKNCNASEKFRLERCEQPIEEEVEKDVNKVMQTIRSFGGTYLRANKSEWTVDMVPAPPGASENWFLEEHNDLVALKGHGGSNKPEQYLSAQSDGSVKLERHASNNEMWRPFDNGKGFWSFQSCDEKWLSTGVDGRVCTTENREKFWLEKSMAQLSAETAGRRCIRSYHNTFLRANNASWTVDLAPASSEVLQVWYLEDYDGQIALKAHKAANMPEQYLRSMPNGAVKLQGHVKRCELWTPHKNEFDDSWSFQDCDGQWLSADVNSKVSTEKFCKAWEKFWFSS